MASNKESTSVADIKESSKGINDPYLDARREWNERYGSYRLCCNIQNTK